MSQMPDFDPGPAGLEPPAPKKPRRKPTRRRKVIASADPKRKKRKRRAVKRTAPDNHAVDQFTPEVYRLLGALMGLNSATRKLAILLAQGLTK